MGATTNKVPEVIASTLGSEKRANDVLRAIHEAGYVCVPRYPTKEMLTAAWADVLGEDAAGVWSSMINAAGSSSSG